MDLELCKSELQKYASPIKAAASARFFKTGPGQYGAGDVFIGVNVPEQRKVARMFYRKLRHQDFSTLLQSPVHEHRLTALLMMVMRFWEGDDTEKRDLFEMYMDNRSRINNWDLVDSSAPYIVGGWLQGNEYRLNVLRTLAVSESLWDKRIAMVSTLFFIAQGSSYEALSIAEVLINDKHDLIHKAVGWMLREVGKRDESVLREFLDMHAATMPRTALRYALEKLPQKDRKYYMGLKHKLEK